MCISQGAATTSLVRHGKSTPKAIVHPNLALQVLFSKQQNALEGSSSDLVRPGEI